MTSAPSDAVQHAMHSLKHKMHHNLLDELARDEGGETILRRLSAKKFFYSRADGTGLKVRWDP
jgi:hypothetical protein